MADEHDSKKDKNSPNTKPISKHSTLFGKNNTGCPYLENESKDTEYSDCYYHDYLQLDKILTANAPRSTDFLGSASHDEHLFITIHQAYELWFKQVLYEIDSCIDGLGADILHDREILKIVSRLQRVNKIIKLLVEQFTILDTMTPMNFLDFRKYLKPASGFQSVQFRILENKLGLDKNKRMRYNKQEYTNVLTEEHKNLVLTKTENKKTFFNVIEKWLERFPYLQSDEWSFWKEYKSAVNDYILQEKQLYLSNIKIKNMNKKQKELLQQELDKAHQQHIQSFNSIFDEKQYKQLKNEEKVSLSYTAMQASLMIMLYREEPVLQMPFKLLESAMEMDGLLTQWRNAHALMVHRMLGSKMGTGGSSGFHYLRTAAIHHKVFADFFNLSTYMIPGSNLPQLPNSLNVFMNFPSVNGKKIKVRMEVEQKEVSPIGNTFGKMGNMFSKFDVDFEHNGPIVVIGAGLTGCCMTLLLSKLFKQTRIILVESRDDYRKELEIINDSIHGQFTDAATRSINLALSYRGICALKACDIYSEIIKKDLLILMKGRYVHLDGSSKISKQLYGQEHEGIYSISRLTLNCLFLDELSKTSNVELKFKCKVTKVLQNGSILLQNGKIIESSFVLGCDGAYSSVRSSLQRLGRYNFSCTYVEHGYKELTIFPKQFAENNNIEFKMEPNYLHIWPKHEFMLIALPNPDKTFTCTLFAPWKVLETLDNKNNIEMFFKNHFPDFIQLCPNYIKQCLKQPASPLAYVNVNKWYYKNKILLLGDAAHAIVPFYGQGMNAGFEDCLILYNMFKEKLKNNNFNNGINNINIEEIFKQFSNHRQPSTAALSKLSLQNYVEMRSLTAKYWFIYKKKLEKTMNFFAPKLWKPIYSMVAFSTIPYDDALIRAKKQDTYLSIALSITAIACTSSIFAFGYKHNLWNIIKNKWMQYIIQTK